ncbi:type I-E CRISPR-associated protein Cse2/CasB [Nocardiopsis alba]|uniref:type I-E CRISPR-associated protein Cse2/CasB n=1 Tax=Nocardiopsis alba TaxID=53437 RepID=UPI00366AD545
MTDKEVLRAADRMVEHLQERVRDEPAVRAVLQRASGKRVEDPAVLPVHEFVARYLDRLLASIEEDDQARWYFPEADVERAFYGVAAMLAAQPRQARDRIGGEDEDTADEAVEKDTSTADQKATDTEGTERRPSDPLRRRSNLGAALGKAVTQGRLNADTTKERLHLLCRQSVDGVHEQLPRLILHANNKDVPIDWGRLALDLSRWGVDRDSVAKEWSQGYHRTIETEKAGRDEALAEKNSTDDDSEDQAA